MIGLGSVARGERELPSRNTPEPAWHVGIASTCDVAAAPPYRGVCAAGRVAHPATHGGIETAHRVANTAANCRRLPVGRYNVAPTAANDGVTAQDRVGIGRREPTTARDHRKVGSGIVVLYSTFGGIRGVTATDVIQFGVLIIATPIIFNVGLENAGIYELVITVNGNSSDPVATTLYSGVSS